ncbi:hypothetical protein D9757_000699 [Collybiopsis confluens]|uniref:Uncharacterized protein n=1 Tax=Collybiopsis confluens TaxID=2823264 RepID=A0A8H5MGB9_9AGAR|nr:hypothetical protein D9757_000699 [Collybiopsis confluens]
MSAKPYPSSPSSVSSCETSSYVKAMSECTRKRKRPVQKDQDFDPSNSRSLDDPNKTRRINPYKLAERLPDGLVQEMETFITPGAIMPTFEVRKELQIRYQVDRRHLYDYFHSRGLRVAKEDRHSNLARSRIAKAKASAQTPGSHIKENIPAKPAKAVKLPPAKRGSINPARQRIKKAVLLSCNVSTVATSSSHTLQQQDVATSPVLERGLCSSSLCVSEQALVREDRFLNTTERDTDYALQVTAPFESQPSLCENSTIDFVHNIPSVTADISSDSMSTGSSDFAEDAQLNEIAAQFLNISPESDDLDCSLLDSFSDLPSAPSMIGDLASALDRKNMYAYIDSNLNETTFFLRDSPLNASLSAPLEFHFNSSPPKRDNLAQTLSPHVVSSHLSHKPLPSYSTSIGLSIPSVAPANAGVVYGIPLTAGSGFYGQLVLI